jgi:hypothetical protein
VSDVFVLVFSVGFHLIYGDPYVLRVCSCSCLGEFVGLHAYRIWEFHAMGVVGMWFYCDGSRSVFC